MKFYLFLKDKLYFILTFLIIYFILLLSFFAFQVNDSFIVFSSLLLFFFVVFTLLFEYFRKRKFYRNLLTHIAYLDKAYLVLETLEEANFYDGEILYQALYEINKSMNEYVKSLEEQMIDFKNYIEMWVHEVKIPISSLFLISHNHKDKFDFSVMEQLKRIEDYVEQVLYYSRLKNAEKDYLIKEVSLNKVVGHVALKYKDDLLASKIDFKVHDVGYLVYTDSKWLEFILNQIVSNSIKYQRKEVSSYIEIFAREDSSGVILTILDNGIGISKEDIPKVFDQSFTGKNGRIVSKSTGMGLFIAKNLCQKLGHKIEIESSVNQYTKVHITFSKSEFYDVLK